MSFGHDREQVDGGVVDHSLDEFDLVEVLLRPFPVAAYIVVEPLREDLIEFL